MCDRVAGRGVRTSSARVDRRRFLSTAATVGIGSTAGFGTASASSTVSSGEEIWRHPIDGNLVSSPTVAGGVVLVGGSEGYLHAVDAETGEEVWRFATDGPVTSSPTVVGGTAYVGSDDGSLYAVDAGVDGASEGSRVMLGTLGHHGASRYAGQTGGTGASTGAPGDNSTGPSNDDGGDGTPGFGVASALAGLGGAAYGLRRARANERGRCDD